MSIKIERVDGGYTAEVTPSPTLPGRWRTVRPLSARELQEKLIGLGYHLQDIVDAFYFADPQWMESE
jgi:hypothetical protein